MRCTVLVLLTGNDGGRLLKVIDLSPAMLLAHQRLCENLEAVSSRRPAHALATARRTRSNGHCSVRWCWLRCVAGVDFHSRVALRRCSAEETPTSSAHRQYVCRQK